MRCSTPSKPPSLNNRRTRPIPVPPMVWVPHPLRLLFRPPLKSSIRPPSNASCPTPTFSLLSSPCSPHLPHHHPARRKRRFTPEVDVQFGHQLYCRRTNCSRRSKRSGEVSICRCSATSTHRATHRLPRRPTLISLLSCLISPVERRHLRPQRVRWTLWATTTGGGRCKKKEKRMIPLTYHPTRRRHRTEEGSFSRRRVRATFSRPSALTPTDEPTVHPKERRRPCTLRQQRHP